MENRNLADIRSDYSKEQLSEESVNRDPIRQFSVWLDEALAAKVSEPTAMAVATVDPHGKPSSRIVLLKGVDETGFVFFTNYTSKKGTDIATNANVSLHFFWPELERQVIVSGTASRVSSEVSKEYFSSRPRASQIGAWASHQSSVLDNRKHLEDRVTELEARFGDEPIPCPDFWGGFCVKASRIEFWQGRPSRLHDRIVFERIGNDWTIRRLSP